jgi:glycosyl transferase family 87
MLGADRSHARAWVDKLAWIAVFCVGAVLGARPLCDPNGYSDFTVSLRAAAVLWSGDPHVYRGFDGRPEAFGYAHVTLVPWMLLLQVASPRAIEIAFGISQGLALVWLARELLRIFGTVTWQSVLVFVLLFGRCFSNNFGNGQFALWGGALVAFAIRALLERRAMAPGLALAAATALKLTPLLFVPSLPFLRRARAALSMACWLVLLVLVVPWPLLGTELNFATLAAFRDAMLAPLVHGGGQSTIWNTYGLSISGATDHLLAPAIARPVKIVWSLVVLAIAFAGWLRSRAFAERERVLLGACLVVLLMALFSPHTKPYHFLLSIVPAFWFCAHGPRGLRALWYATALCWLVAFPLRQRALLGETLWRAIDELPVAHLGVVLLLCWTSARRPPTVAA